MILALIPLLLYKFKFVNSAFDGQCNQNMMANALNACRDININIYQPVPDNDDTFESFLSAAAETITGEIPILGPIVQWGVDNLIKAGAASGGPSQAYVFQSKVNEAFQQMSSCIDQKIDSRLAEEARKNFNAVGLNFIKIANSLKSTGSNPIGQALLITTLIAEFQATMNKISQLIKQYFVLSPGTTQTYNYFLYNLPVFEEAALLYNQIYSSYAASLKKVPGQISDPLFKQYYEYAVIDAGILTNWIITARQTIQTAFTLNGYENLLLNAPLSFSVGAYDQSRWGDALILLGTGGRASMIVELAPDSHSYALSLELNSLGGGKITCQIVANDGCLLFPIPPFWDTMDMAPCLQVYRTTNSNLINQYRTSVDVYITKLAQEYYEYTTKINNKLANIKTKYNL